MPRILSIFSSKRFPAACFLAVFCIVVGESVGYFVLQKRSFNHEVDEILYQINSHTFDADYLLLGDSVGRQLLEQFSEDPRYAWLASNQAVETTGQFFIIRRYLEKNQDLEGVIFVGLPFQDKNLEQQYTENFVYRPFTRFDEIWSIFKVKHNPALVLKMLVYKYLQSFKYRLRLQDKIAGFTNSDIYTGVDSAARISSPGNYSLLALLQEQFSEKESSWIHFISLLDYLDQHQIDFYYIPAPVEKLGAKETSPIYIQHQLLVDKRFPLLKKRYPRFHYLTNLVEHDKSLFRDHIHYTVEGLPLGEDYVRRRINSIVK